MTHPTVETIKASLPIGHEKLETQAKKDRHDGSFFAFYSTLMVVLNADRSSENAGLQHMSSLEKNAERQEKQLQTLENKLPAVSPSKNSKYQVDPTVLMQQGYLQALTVKTHILNNQISATGNEESSSMTDVSNTEQASAATAGNARNIIKQADTEFRAV